MWCRYMALWPDYLLVSFVQLYTHRYEMHARLMSISASPTCFLMLIPVNSGELVGKMPLPITPSQEVPLHAVCLKLLKDAIV